MRDQKMSNLDLLVHGSIINDLNHWQNKVTQNSVIALTRNPTWTSRFLGRRSTIEPHQPGLTGP